LSARAPYTYEATLATTLAIGYPTGSLMPVGIGHQLLRYDSAWLWQPNLAFLAALLALALYAVLSGVIESPPAPGARALRVSERRDRVSSASSARRVPRRAAGNPLRLRALGRDQGAHRGAAAR